MICWRIFLLFGFNLQFIIFVETKVALIVDEKVENCVKPDDAAGIFDFSNLKILVVNDTHSYFNGTVEFKKDLRRPWVYRILAEKYHRGQWVVQAMDRRIADMCEKMHDPSELWYNIFKNVEKCPRPAGSIWTWDMIPANFPQYFLDLIPHYYMGRWRLTTTCEFEMNGIVKKDCIRYYADMFDD